MCYQNRPDAVEVTSCRGCIFLDAFVTDSRIYHDRILASIHYDAVAVASTGKDVNFHVQAFFLL
jgi:hypothetical protein